MRVRIELAAQDVEEMLGDWLQKKNYSSEEVSQIAARIVSSYADDGHIVLRAEPLPMPTHIVQVPSAPGWHTAATAPDPLQQAPGAAGPAPAPKQSLPLEALRDPSDSVGNTRMMPRGAPLLLPEYDRAPALHNAAAKVASTASTATHADNEAHVQLELEQLLRESEALQHAARQQGSTPPRPRRST